MNIQELVTAYKPHEWKLAELERGRGLQCVVCHEIVQPVPNSVISQEQIYNFLKRQLVGISCSEQEEGANALTFPLSPHLLGRR